MDGGSVNSTSSLFKSYGCKVESRPDLLEFAQVRMAMGIKKAKNEIILILEPDNILVGKNWMSDMISPFIDDKKIFCTFSMYNTYEKDMPNLVKYCALFGIPDPTLYYLQKSEKLPLFKKKYYKGQILREEKKYTVVSFTKENLPTLGDNGHMFRTKLLQSEITDLNKFTHTDVASRLVVRGYNRVGVVRNQIIHVSESKILNLVKQRVRIKRRFYDSEKNRDYLVFNPKVKRDKINLVLYIFFSYTFLVPLLVSIRGFIYKREPAWFLHPLLCFVMCTAYGISEAKKKIAKS